MSIPEIFNSSPTQAMSLNLFYEEIKLGPAALNSLLLTVGPEEKQKAFYQFAHEIEVELVHGI
jgi:hypothetical protein